MDSTIADKSPFIRWLPLDGHEQSPQPMTISPLLMEVSVALGELTAAEVIPASPRVLIITDPMETHEVSKTIAQQYRQATPNAANFPLVVNTGEPIGELPAQSEGEANDLIVITERASLALLSTPTAAGRGIKSTFIARIATRLKDGGMVIIGPTDDRSGIKNLGFLRSSFETYFSPVFQAGEISPLQLAHRIVSNETGYTTPDTMVVLKKPRQFAPFTKSPVD